MSLVRPPSTTRSRTTKPDSTRATPQRGTAPDGVRPAAPTRGHPTTPPASAATAVHGRPGTAAASGGTAAPASTPARGTGTGSGTIDAARPSTATSPDALAHQFDAVAGDRPGTAPRSSGDGGRPGTTGSGGSRPPGAGRRAKLRLSKVNPITVTRLSFAFSLCVFVVLLVAVAVLWFVLNSIGVFNSVSDAADTLTDSSAGDVRGWLSFGRAMEISLLIGAINVILMTALTTLGALLYNLCAEMIGGIEVTLSDQ